MIQFVIQEYRRDREETWYVAAIPGWMRQRDGSYKRDGSVLGGPEWTKKRDHAYLFKTHRSAALVRSKCPSAKIVQD